jgi:hypothetical protein
MADSSDIDNAVIARLGADATLLALVPNGVYWDQAPPDATRFVVVSFVDEQDVQQFGGRSYEDNLYAVEVRMLSTANGNPKAAFARVDALLEGASFSIPGYTLMTCYREARDRKTERDESDTSILWFRRLGHYRVMASL